jgi:NADH:ubiquinone oxidoreductase subunit 6 (subunit J)
VNLVLTISSAVFIVTSALGIALGREPRWSIIYWWVNGLASSSLLLCFGAELLAVVMAVSVTACSLAFFLHSDTFGGLRGDERAQASRLHPRMIFPLVVSIGVGLMVVALLKAALSGAVQLPGADLRGESFFAEESFIAFQLVALFGLASVLGAGVIARPARRTSVSARDGVRND